MAALVGLLARQDHPEAVVVAVVPQCCYSMAMLLQLPAAAAAAAVQGLAEQVAMLMGTMRPVAKASQVRLPMAAQVVSKLETVVVVVVVAAA
jgi:hypothetical protein